MDTDYKPRLVTLLKARSLERGAFTLASGRKSSYYIDARPTTMSAEGLHLIGQLGFQALQATSWPAELVGGLTLGADPVAYAIAVASRAASKPLDAFTVRKQAKGHGRGRRIEGAFDATKPVVVVEDVITSGGSVLEAIDVIVEAGGHVTGVLAVVDREEGGVAAITAKGYRVTTLVRVTDLGVTPNTR